MNIKIDKIKEILALMEEHDLQEIEVELEGMKIRLKKRGAEIQYVSGPMTAGVNTGSLPAAAPAEESAVVAHNFLEVKAPMVGTFYRAPSPGSEPFVDRGKVVASGDALCIIEAMKLMNVIKSDVNGKIIKILAENETPVQAGQVLFLVDPVRPMGTGNEGI